MQQNGNQQSMNQPEMERFGENFLPNFCSIRAVFVVVVSTELLALVITLAAVRDLKGFAEELSVVSLLVQWIALSTAGLLCLFRRWIQQQGNRLAGFLAWGLLLLMTVLVSESSIVLSNHLDPWQSMLDHPGLLIRCLGISMIVGLLVLHYLHLQYRWRQQMEAENAARLQALHSRIRPHFLFNSMNTIASLTRSDPAMAEEVVEDLADLFRVSLGEVTRFSSLERELELARQYLNIEAHRLGGRLRVEWDLVDLPQSALIPPLILQPLLENAVYHGIEPATEGGTICINGRYRRSRINLSIRNTLPETSAPSSHRRGNRLAVDNIRQRLAGLFDEQARLTTSRVDGEYQVRLVIPHPWRLD